MIHESTKIDYNMKKGKTNDKISENKLEKEKKQLEQTIAMLNKQLVEVNQKLENLSQETRS